MKKLLVLVIVLALVLGCLVVRFRFLPEYRHRKEARFAEQAASFMEKKDYRNAQLSAVQALQLNTNNVQACRIMAELADLASSPQAIDWRRRIAQLDPSIKNKLMLASTALWAQGPPFPIAVQTLEEIRGEGEKVADYHAVAGQLALRLNKAAEAAAEYATASELEPTNGLHRLNLAVLQMSSTNQAASTQARQTLEQLGDDPRIGIFALRWLIGACLARNDPTSAERFSEKLLKNPEANLQDRLLRLGILRKIKDPKFGPELEAVQGTSSTNAIAIYTVCTWMLGQGMSNEALNWVKACPAKVRAEQPAPLAMVDCLVAQKNWTELETFLQAQKWGEREFLRLAFLSRTAEEQKQPLGVDSRWRGAVREAEDRIGSLTRLLDLASAWGRTKQREDLLWVIVERCPRERWALTQLRETYTAQGNTRGLYKVYSTLARFDTKDLGVANNLAATSLLLRVDLSAAHQLAKEIYGQHSDDPIVVSTYAYSLHLQGRSKEGLAAFDKLKSETLQEPSVALYYGVLLSATGQKDAAGKYLALAQKAVLLPEEKTLLDEATKTL